jgi:dihydroorotase
VAGRYLEGAVADIAILNLKKGSFGFIDARNNRLDGDKKLEAEMTIREGKIVWDLNGLAAESWLNNQKLKL